MKGFKDSEGKFHPMKKYNGMRKSGEQKLKTQGVRMARMDDQRDPHEGGQAVLDTLSGSKVNGVPFFKLSGIRNFVLYGENEIFFNKIPKNPNRVEKIHVKVDRGADAFDASFFLKNTFEPALVEKGLYVDQLAPALANGLGLLK